MDRKSCTEVLFASILQKNISLHCFLGFPVVGSCNVKIRENLLESKSGLVSLRACVRSASLATSAKLFWFQRRIAKIQAVSKLLSKYFICIFFLILRQKDYVHTWDFGWVIEKNVRGKGWLLLCDAHLCSSSISVDRWFFLQIVGLSLQWLQRRMGSVTDFLSKLSNID